MAMVSQPDLHGKHERKIAVEIKYLSLEWKMPRKMDMMDIGKENDSLFG